MKYNLKNRPNWKELDPLEWNSQTLEWFEDFEKELRELYVDVTCKWIIKEILGE